jgi:hypothetical protein
MINVAEAELTARVAAKAAPRKRREDGVVIDEKCRGLMTASGMTLDEGSHKTFLAYTYRAWVKSKKMLRKAVGERGR